MNCDSFFKFQNESKIDNSRKYKNRAYPSALLPSKQAGSFKCNSALNASRVSHYTVAQVTIADYVESCVRWAYHVNIE